MTRLVIIIFALLPGLAAAAAVEAYDRDQLIAALEKSAPCCVIDARSAGKRLAKPLADSLVYRRGMKINPTAAVAVIGDTDDIAVRAAEDVAATNAAPQVIAVKGGMRTWEAATSAGRSGDAANRLFVIPKNTCEQDTPLQILRSAPAKTPK